ncbi:MAG TPA: hypothetical protein PK230_12815, partial [Chitinophagales bacterium]|nr:hypothetical protein [Chitinophagales bacterium]
HNALIGFYPDKLQELVELCLLFGYKDLYRKYITFLQEAVIGDTRAGAITNIPPITPEQTIQIAQNTKQIKSNEALLMAYPSRDNHYYLAYWSKYEEYVRKTLAGQYQEAIRLALDTKDEWYIECIASTLVLMNKFDIAQEVANQYLTQNYRIEAFNIVKAIEYQRIGEWYISFSLIKEHFAKNISIFDLLIYIKGLNGLEPWGGYPYCDY